jgi:predicted dehydrogenase
MADFVKNGRRPGVLLAGYGAFGAVHARAWAAFGLADRLIIADPDPDARKRAALDCPRARVIEDWRRGLGGAEIADVVAPTDRHAEIALGALDAGLDVLIEKPMAATRAEAEAIAERARRRGLVVQVAFPLRAHRLFRRLREVARAGGLGAVHWVEAEFVALKRPRADSGVVLNDAIHMLDLLCLLFGAPRRVQASVGHPLGRRHEDAAMIVLGWPDGRLARVDASCAVPGERPDPVVAQSWARKRLSLTGAQGQANLDFVADTLEMRWGGLRAERDGFVAALDPPAGVIPAPSPIGDLVEATMREFLDRVLDRGRPEANPEDAGVGLALLADAIFASAREGAPILLPDRR